MRCSPPAEGSQSVRPSLLGASLRSPPPPQGAAGSSLACCRLPAVSPAPAATQPASARPYGRREPLGACPQPRFVLRAAGCNLLGLFVLFVLLFFLSLFNSFFFFFPFPPSPLPPPRAFVPVAWLPVRFCFLPARRLRTDRRVFVTERQPAILDVGWRVGGVVGNGGGDIKNNFTTSRYL